MEFSELQNLQIENAALRLAVKSTNARIEELEEEVKQWKMTAATEAAMVEEFKDKLNEAEFRMKKMREELWERTNKDEGMG